MKSDNKNKEQLTSPEWTYDFEEFILDIQIVQLDKWYVAILGEHNLCVLNENGSLFFIKKFDSQPSCFHAFANENKTSLIIMVVTQMCNLLVYQNDIIRWATKVPFIPVAVKRCNFNDISGCIALLSDDGHLTVGYLGTNPSLKIISMPNISENHNNEMVEQELKEIKNMINIENNQSETTMESNFNECINFQLLDFQRINNESFILVTEVFATDVKISRAKFVFHHNDFYDFTPNEQDLNNFKNQMFNHL